MKFSREHKLDDSWDQIIFRDIVGNPALKSSLFEETFSVHPYN